MTACSVAGNADMYGLGIRLGFYLQWAASLLANALLLEGEIAGNRLALTAFMWGVLVALLVQTVTTSMAITSSSSSSDGGGPLITAVDVYVTTLMCFGYNYFGVPTMLWRLLTCFEASVDPTRWTWVPYGRAAGALSSLLLAATSAYQLWFWVAGVRALPLPGGGAGEGGCPSPVGFLFVPQPLRGNVLRSVNIVLQSLILFPAAVGVVMYLLRRGGGGKARPPTAAADPGIYERTKLLHRVRVALTAAVAGIVIAATELAIRWNGVAGVNDVDSAGQLIPLALGAIVLLHVLWVWWRGDGDDDREGGSARREARREPMRRVNRQRPEPWYFSPEGASGYMPADDGGAVRPQLPQPFWSGPMVGSSGPPLREDV